MSSYCAVLAAVATVVAAVPFSTTSSLSHSKRADASTFYIVDNDSGTLANAVADPSGIFFGSDRNAPTLFSIDASTGILMTADPGQTVYDSYIESGEYSPVQIGTAASDGFVKCSLADDVLSCSADGSYTSFMLGETAENASDYQLYLVQSGTVHANAVTASLSVQYSTPAPSANPTKFYLSTSMGYAVDFGANSGIYSGSDFAKEAPGNVYTLDSNTGYLMTSTSSSDDSASSNIAYIDSSNSDEYTMVQLAPAPLSSSSSSTMVPLTCEIASDGTMALSCQANDYQTMWLNLSSSTSGDYTLYMGNAASTSNGRQRVSASIVVSNCSACS